MNIFSDLRDYIPTGDRLYTLLAVIIIIVVLLGYGFFIGNNLLPDIKARSELAEGFTQAEQDLINLQKTSENAEQNAQQEITVAQSGLEQAAANFMSQEQAANTLQNIYVYAANNNVIIVDLKTLPIAEKDPSIPIDTNSFALEVEGNIANLLSFMGSIQEIVYRSFLVDAVNIAQGEDQAKLTMNVSILTSPYAPQSDEGTASNETPAGGQTGGETGAGLLPTPIVITHEYLESQLDAVWAGSDWPAAIEILEQLVIMKPGDQETVEKLYAAHVNYGYLFRSANQTENAQNQFDLALSIKPNGIEAQEGLEACSAAQGSSPQFVSHTVQAGETLYSISRKYGADVQAIKLANNLPDNTIKTGQVLTIPLQ